MNELVYLKSDEAQTDSLKVAEFFHKRHDRVLRAIDDLIESFPKNGERKIVVENSTTESMFKFTTYKAKDNQMHRICYMNRDGFTLLAMGFNGKKAMEWKLKYIAAFNKMESVLKEKSTQAWIETRQQGKITRKAETDVIKELVEYAKTQGSTHSQMLYMTYSKLANRMVGIKGKERDIATTSQLNNLGIFENIILNLIRVGMSQDMDYHDIYRLCEGRCVQAKEIAMIGG